MQFAGMALNLYWMFAEKNLLVAEAGLAIDKANEVMMPRRS
jgi:hypothetical protein